jgi:hypothetical protein
MLADDWNGLGGGDVVARSPVGFVGSAVEIFLDNLLSPRESISAAHREIMADETSDRTVAKRIKDGKIREIDFRR